MDSYLGEANSRLFQLLQAAASHAQFVPSTAPLAPVVQTMLDTAKTTVIKRIRCHQKHTSVMAHLSSPDAWKHQLFDLSKGFSENLKKSAFFKDSIPRAMEFVSKQLFDFYKLQAIEYSAKVEKMASLEASQRYLAEEMENTLTHCGFTNFEQLDTKLRQDFITAFQRMTSICQELLIQNSLSERKAKVPLNATLEANILIGPQQDARSRGSENGVPSNLARNTKKRARQRQNRQARKVERLKKEETSAKSQEGRTTIPQLDNRQTLNKTQIYSIHALTKVRIPTDMEEILSRGIGYIPHLDINVSNLAGEWSTCIDQFVRLNRRELLHLQPVQIEATAHLIERLMLKKCLQYNRKNEMSQFRKLQKFLTSNNLIIQEADKNLGIAVIDRTLYIKLVTEHLDQKEYYRVLESPPDWKSLKKKLSDICVKHKSEKFFEVISPFENFKQGEFQGLPKVHKETLSIRPIIPCVRAFTTRASKFLDEQLQPIIKKYKWCVQGTYDCLLRLRETQCIGHDAILVAADVESLYTNIDTKDALTKINRILLREKIPDHQFLIDVLEWVITNNYFTFNETWYHQIKGTAMGTNVAPAYANLYMIFYEDALQKTLPPGIFPSVYMRFLDDIFFAFEKKNKDGLVDLDAFDFLKMRLNRLSPSLKLKFEISDSHVPFLDLLIYKGDYYSRYLMFDHKLYVKPTNLHLYTDPDSFQPYNYKYAWLTGEQIRIMRNNTHEDEYSTSLNEFKGYLLNRGYNQNIINSFIKYSWNDRPFFMAITRKQQLGFYPIYTSNIPGRELIVEAIKMLSNIIAPWLEDGFHNPKAASAIVRRSNVSIATFGRQTNRLVLSRECRIPDTHTQTSAGALTGPVQEDSINLLPPVLAGIDDLMTLPLIDIDEINHVLSSPSLNDPDGSKRSRKL